MRTWTLLINRSDSDVYYIDESIEIKKRDYKIVKRFLPLPSEEYIDFLLVENFQVHDEWMNNQSLLRMRCREMGVRLNSIHNSTTLHLL